MLSLKLRDIYTYLNGKNPSRQETGMSEQAHKKIPHNYFIILLSNTLTKFGDALINPKTVLSWIMNLSGAPLYLISLIVPIRESGSMLPQIFISYFVEQYKIRKWIWISGALMQSLSVLSIGFIALNFSGPTAGYLIITALLIFSLSRGLCSISSKDILGKTIPKKKRGSLKGYTVSVSGILVLAAGLYLFFNKNEDIQFYGTLVIFAGSLWFLAALIFSQVKESMGEKSGNEINLKDSLKKLSLLKTDQTFRNFIISRSLLLCSSLSAPFYVILAQNNLGNDSFLLALFIIANGLASIISAPVWGKLADKSSKNVMAVASVIASVTGLILIGSIWKFSELAQQMWLYPLAFFVLGIAHSGVRLGRKTYIVDIAEGNQRTDYVSISNTIIGLILLFSGALSALLSFWSVLLVILLLSLLGIMGAVKSYFLPNAEAND